MASWQRRTTPEHELALLLSGTAALRARHGRRILQLAQTVDMSRLEAVVRAQGMLTLVGHRLQQHFRPSAAFRSHMEEHAQQARRQGIFQEMLTIRLTAALAESGVRALPLKGPFLGERLYTDLGARVSADIDLLVARTDLLRAVEILAGVGYRRHRLLPLSLSNPPALHERMIHPSGLTDVELHWRVHWGEERFSAGMLARSVRERNGVLVAEPRDELTALLLMYARDGFAGLRLAADIAACWDRHAHELGSCGIVRVARDHPTILPTLATAVALTERLVGVPGDQLLSKKQCASASPLAIRLANWSLHGSRSQIDANAYLVELVLSHATERRAVMYRQFVLAPREAAGPDHHVRSRFSSIVSHTARVLRRFAIAIATVLLRGAWAPLPESSARVESGPPRRRWPHPCD